VEPAHHVGVDDPVRVGSRGQVEGEDVALRGDVGGALATDDLEGLRPLVGE
jgi:hypothetical protein